MSNDTRPVLRRIDIAGFPPVAAPAAGAAPKLEWLRLADLVIDPLYQRDITDAGRRNIVKIAQTFCWASFSTVLVAPAGIVGKYKIIDGQHRSHAAALIGLDRVPCQIVDADAAGQALAFHKVNANVTKVHAMATFHALVAAGDARAQAVLDIVRDAGVTICRYPVPADKIKPAHTLVAYRLEDFVRAHGRPSVVLALRAIASTAGPAAIRPGNAGLLKVEMIGGAAAAIAPRLHWGEAALLDGFRTFDLGYVRDSGGGQWSRLAAIRDELGRRLDRFGAPRGLKPQRAAAPVGVATKKISLAPVPSLARGGA